MTTISKRFLPALLLSTSVLLVALASAQVPTLDFFTLNPSAEDGPQAPGDPPPTLMFGFRVAIYGNTAFVSLPEADPPRVAVFTRDAAGQWSRTSTIENEIGSSLALHGNHALIVSGNVLAALRRTTQGWVRTQVIDEGSLVSSLVMKGRVAAYVASATPTTTVQVLYRDHRGRWLRGPTLTPRDGGEWGSSLALSKHTLVVGASSQNDQRGAVYVLERVGWSWREVQKILAPDDDARAFGAAVAVRGDRIAIGAPFSLPSDEFSGNSTGAAYVFARHGRLWHQTQRLQPRPGDLFGEFVALTHSMLTVVSAAPDRFSDAELFVYEPRGPLRTYEIKGAVVLSATAGVTDHAASGDTALVGVPFDSPLATGYVAGYDNSLTQ